MNTNAIKSHSLSEIKDLALRYLGLYYKGRDRMGQIELNDHSELAEGVFSEGMVSFQRLDGKQHIAAFEVVCMANKNLIHNKLYYDYLLRYCFLIFVAILFCALLLNSRIHLWNDLAPWSVCVAVGFALVSYFLLPVLFPAKFYRLDLFEHMEKYPANEKWVVLSEFIFEKDSSAYSSIREICNRKKYGLLMLQRNNALISLISPYSLSLDSYVVEKEKQLASEYSVSERHWLSYGSISFLGACLILFGLNFWDFKPEPKVVDSYPSGKSEYPLYINLMPTTPAIALTNANSVLPKDIDLTDLGRSYWTDGSHRDISYQSTHSDAIQYAIIYKADYYNFADAEVDANSLLPSLGSFVLINNRVAKDSDITQCFTLAYNQLFDSLEEAESTLVKIENILADLPTSESLAPQIVIWPNKK